MDDVNTEQELPGTEEVELTAVEEVAAPVVFTGLANDINDEISELEVARDLAVSFEGGLTTKADILRTSIALRNILFETKKSCHGLYADCLEIKAQLLEDIGEVQKVSKKADLEAKIKEMEEALAAM